MSDRLQQVHLHWHEDGTPVSDIFEDIYFSTGEGITETEHVFMQGNRLMARWQNWTQPEFTIGETGFGTGLNFLVAWTTFREFRRQNPQHPLKTLRFCSVEKFPISREDLEKAYKMLPELRALWTVFLLSYPEPVAGCHHLFFDEKSIHLELWFADIKHMMPERINHRHETNYPLIDAWFLDGFAPSKNPEMWQQSLFEHMIQLSHSKTTLATFTAAGFVRRGLIAAGFDIKKQPGFGKKRDMLVGQVVSKPAS